MRRFPYINMDNHIQGESVKRLELLDYGRFFAAISVVLYHYSFNGIVNGKITSISLIPFVADWTKYGFLGVEFFFMISGYVIFHSAQRRTAAEFAVGRATRLYPVYWVAVLFTSFFAFFWGGELMSVSISQLTVNFTMLQMFVGVANVDGAYWTLAYELIFYFAVFVLLLCGLRNHLQKIFLCWPIVFIVALLLGWQNIFYLGGFFYYFSAGTLLAIIANRFSWQAALGLLTVYGLCVYTAANKAIGLTHSKGVEFSPIVISGIVTLFFLLFLFQNSNKGKSLTLPYSRFAGSITYPLYLIHAHFGYMFINQFATEDNKVVVSITALLIVLFTASIMHFVVEGKLHLIWQNMFRRIIGRPISIIQQSLVRA